ncbi:MAG: sulfurtransferase [Candidatus Delongbacteria bacterium]|nr:sulfurtransferase [Candidatus Delongbacteria bacterium]MBN2833679.1 sulfurtransferase [Candidatus Delongbacteria bacterium]
MRNFVSCEWLKEHLVDEEILIFDTRQDLLNQESGLKEYYQGHIPGAYFLDGENELVGEKKEHGGRHPLPDMSVFAEIMRNFGLNEDSIVITYGFNSARLFYMLKMIGFNRVFLLDGGIKAWTESGYDLSTEIPSPLEGSFLTNFNKEIVVDREYVLENLKGEKFVLVDSRTRERFLGNVEPIDPIAGRIPGAVNWDFNSNFDASGKVISRDEIINRISEFINLGKQIVLYCGSGVTAAYNYVILDELGIKSKIYSGGWSDWISYDNFTMESGENLRFACS